MDAFVEWLRATPLSQFIVFKIWIWPLCETLHFVGLALVIGIAGFFDLRLVGLFPDIAIDDVRELMPLAVAGFLINLVTGSIFFIGHPEQYAHNPSWWWKVGFLGLAGLNALIFTVWVGKQTVGLRPGVATPPSVKAIGVVSLVSWFAVLYFGRMLPFLGSAF